MDEEQYSDRVRPSAREDGPDGPGMMQAHRRRRSPSDVNSTRTNRYFRLRTHYLLQTGEQTSKLFLSRTWSTM